jgi:signal transduction histidine kinase/ADP-ribose pyrophosphatase YjhB (NUDIX family)
MWPRYCVNCGAPLPREDEVSPDAGLGLRCAECEHSNHVAPNLWASGVLLAEGDAGHEVLLVQRRADVARYAGSFALPAKELEFRDDARGAAVRSLWRDAGLKVETLGVLDVISETDSAGEPTLTTWFLVRGKGGDPRPGGEVEEARFFSLDALPDLPPTERLVLDQLRRSLATSDEQATTDLAVRLHRRKQRYRELLEAYTNELMRSAWINDLHNRLGALEGDAAEITREAAEQLATRAEVDEVRVWLPGPPDRCDTCPWAERCPQARCLHLVTGVRGQTPGEVAPSGDSGAGTDSSEFRPEEERIPLFEGVPAADVFLRNQPVRAELPGAGATPHHFEGFPIDSGASKGVLALISRTRMDPNARRLFEVVARHVASLVRNASLVNNLRTANQVKLGFISRMSHELKTPLTAILGYSELLREELQAIDNELGAEGAATIEDSGRKLLGIVESILEIAKLQSGTMRMRLEPLDLLSVVSERLPRWRKKASEREVRINLRCEDDEPHSVSADRGRLHQILDELMDNAIKFSHDRDEVVVELSLSSDEVACSILDRGIGVAPADHERIFDPFQQVSEKIHLDYGGLGNGLALANSLIALQGGRIAIESQLGEGSRLTIWLPKQ